MTQSSWNLPFNWMFPCNDDRWIKEIIVVGRILYFFTELDFPRYFQSLHILLISKLYKKVLIQNFQAVIRQKKRLFQKAFGLILLLAFEWYILINFCFALCFDPINCVTLLRSIQNCLFIFLPIILIFGFFA